MESPSVDMLCMVLTGIAVKFAHCVLSGHVTMAVAGTWLRPLLTQFHT